MRASNATGRFVCSFALFILAMLIAVAAQADEPWRPAKPRLMTQWGERVTPENAWREYPRPQFVRDRWLNLNGLWDYAVTPKTAAQPTVYDGKILVPFAIESALSGVGRALTPEDRLWYRRHFRIPETWFGERILLHFGAVDYQCVLWVNGAIAGVHAGGNDAFTFDITPWLGSGEIELVLAVVDPTDAGEQPRGKQLLKPHGIWYTPVSGIWQTVWVEPVPANLYLQELRFTTDVAASCLWVEVLANEPIEDDRWAVRLTATSHEMPVATTLVRVNRRGRLDLPNAHLWSPDDPFLHALRAELVQVKNPRARGTPQDKQPGVPAFGEAERLAYTMAESVGEPIDTVDSYVAMRRFSLESPEGSIQPRLCVNGEPIFQHGPLDQGWWPDGLLTPPSDEAIVWELSWLKRAGFNMLRKHIKVEPDRYYYHCDQLGLLVWQDMPSGFRGALRNSARDEGEPLRTSASREQHELELRRMINRLYNHPSIAMWVIHNEGWGQYETQSLTRWVKSIDSTRWTNAVSGWLDMDAGDVFDIHTYEEVPRSPAAQSTRAIVIGEYGGVGWPVAGHLWDAENRNWGYQTYQDQPAYVAAMRKKVEALGPMHRDLGLSAAVYTQMTDVEGEVNGFLTYDRRINKIDPEALKLLNDAFKGRK